MHGILHKSLKGYVGENVAEATWNEVMDAAGIEPKLYLPVTRYPDEEFTDAIAAIAAVTDHSEETIQRDVGRFLAPDILNTFKAHVKQGWGTREILAALDGIYKQIRKQDDESALPTVATSRLDPDTYVLEYRSEKRLCDLGKGIIEGIAAEYGDEVTISEEVCLHAGDDHCELTVDFE
ncbi:heme NO-binding domain-containing protein [Haloarchaeobius sp. HME9146]|uniref:heme NO-binding domain-containing protein n=1 Tax=Haloarchaeobius sp. HME9146 TaxID=2978732 RepID=UPI0021C22177|nr:heme NO-binding domain-containing protein [Haloarchaeobius sp. HME9146]MCT9094690.1 heme NO-binding domain-containing protein [Haloarchaeobius sp. HME9146]